MAASCRSFWDEPIPDRAETSRWGSPPLWTWRWTWTAATNTGNNSNMSQDETTTVFVIRTKQTGQTKQCYSHHGADKQLCTLHCPVVWWCQTSLYSLEFHRELDSGCNRPEKRKRNLHIHGKTLFMQPSKIIIKLEICKIQVDRKISVTSSGFLSGS